jgi:hypothetical protein
MEERGREDTKNNAGAYYLFYIKKKNESIKRE